uniref:Uncharacterized protein n=1 Tax=Nelumbo nucifera TaxID=4432 RepID=A0A822XGI7_NELNU|nr:TPA_asm: hypothetical protein HUJ06_019408 [Nelumbo nucifera]
MHLVMYTSYFLIAYYYYFQETNYASKNLNISFILIFKVSWVRASTTFTPSHPRQQYEEKR